MVIVLTEKDMNKQGEVKMVDTLTIDDFSIPRYLLESADVVMYALEPLGAVRILQSRLSASDVTVDWGLAVKLIADAADS